MLKWLESRIGLKTAWNRFLEERLPDRVGWPHVLGSVLLALIAFQFVTGILLSFIYSPSPQSAYLSVRFLMDQMRGGSWLRALHDWGATFIVIVAALHLVRTFVYAAYRKPRELTWIAGLLLLLCILAFGQTGYLLPWDQRSYWGTTVTLQIVHTIPWIGPKLAHLLRGGDNVGALTLSRFYSIHVVLLPLITAFLVLGHLKLIRRFGITAPWTRNGEGSRSIPFYPFQMVKDSVAIFLVLLLLFFFAWQLETPLEARADPSDTTFAPRPDWYFLFLFQMLRYFEGKWEVIGTFVIPALLLTFLFLVPFIDRNPRRELRYRPLALSGLLLFVFLWGWLTYASVEQSPGVATGQRPAGILPARAERIKRPSEVGGLYVAKQYCFECHSMTEVGDRSDLQRLARNHFPTGATWFEQHFQAHGKQFSLNNREVEELTSVLRLIAGDQPELLSVIPPVARFGAHFFYNSSCPQCHTIDGQGGKNPEVPSPDLTLRLLRTKEWHMKHIYDPQSVVRKSKMPPFFHFEKHEYEALAEYMLYLHTP